MATYEKWYPGPNEADEIGSMAALRSAIEIQVFLNVVRDGSNFSGAPTALYTPYTIGYAGNNGQPYIGVRWLETGVDDLFLKIRYSSALVGMLDPLTWFPGIFNNLGEHTQATIEAACTQGSLTAGFMRGLVDTIDLAGLCRSPFTDRNTSAKRYTFGTHNGEAFGVQWWSTYSPNAAEQGDGIVYSVHTGLWTATDADDGTVGWTAFPAEAGENYSQTPQLVADQPGQATSWGDLGDAVDNVKGSIDNTIPELQDIKDEVDKAGTTWAPDTVTNPADVGGAGDVSTAPPVVGHSTFNTPGAAATVAAGGSALMLVQSGGTAIMTLATQLFGAVSAGILSLGLLARAGQAYDIIVSALPGIGNLVTSLGQTTTAIEGASGHIETLSDNLPTSNAQAEAQTVELDRIATALEEIRDELVGDPQDQATDPGIVTATELASQARSKLEVRSHGMAWEAETGGAWEE